MNRRFDLYRIGHRHRHRYSHGLRLIAILAWLAAPGLAAAQAVTAVRSHGDPANRVDLVILGDGYTSADIADGKYAQDVEAFVAQMFFADPYLEYERFYNVSRIDVVSAQSGSDHPSTGVFRATALDSTYDCGGIQRLVCVDVSKVNAVLAASGVAANARDAILVIVNDPEYGGSGGAVAVASTHALAVEIILHELGHSFALLADEYGGPPPPACNSSMEPWQANATAQTTRALIKWVPWIDAATPVPTPGAPLGLPGLYQGAAYCDLGLYRPTYDSKMRTLNRPFEPINTEEHIRRIYNLVAPIDSWSPTPSAVAIVAGELLSASITVPQPRTRPLNVVWRVNGAVVGTGTNFSTTELSVGSHLIVATVTDTTPLVRDDPAQLLTEAHAWTVTVSPPPRRRWLAAPTR